MKKYKTTYPGTEVSVVEVDRQTTDSVWIAGKRKSKSGAYAQYHDTFEDAKKYLTVRYEIEVCKAKRQLDQARSYLGTAQSLKSPD